MRYETVMMDNPLAGLLSAMSGQQLPPPIVCSLMNIDPDALTVSLLLARSLLQHNPVLISSAQHVGFCVQVM